MNFQLIFASLLWIGCRAEVDITKGPPPYDKPWVPAWGFNKSDHHSWQARQMYLLKQTEKHRDQIKLVFFGDSRTYYWIEPGLEVWHKYYGNRGAFNYGIRGDSSRQLLWRIEHKEFDGLDPKLLVFMIGGNNFKNNENRGTDEEIAKAYGIVIEKLRHKLPKTQIIVVEEIPRKTDGDRARNINSLMGKEFESKTDKFVHILNPYNDFLTDSHKQNKGLYVSDGFHLNKEGYEVLAKLLEPLVKKLLE